MPNWDKYGGVVWRVAVVVAFLHVGAAFAMIQPSVSDVSVKNGEALSSADRTIVVEGHSLRGGMAAPEVTVEDVATGEELPVEIPASNCERKVLESRLRCHGYTSCEREIPPGGLRYDCRFEIRLERLPPKENEVRLHYLDETWRFPTREGTRRDTDTGE